jgi:hypothetical protein
MPLTCEAPAIAITSANYMNPYIPPSGIPSAVPSSAIINSDGVVNNEELNTYVNNTLLVYAPPPAGGLNPTTNLSLVNEATAYSNKAKQLRDSMNAEYCWYYTRYIWALTNLLTTAAQSGAVLTPAMKDNVATLNTKLNKILLVMKAAINSRLNRLNQYYNSDINSQNAALNTARQTLKAHSDKLKSNDLKSDIQSSLIEYSIEKNTTSRNLMAVYGFMNIVAVGLLFYLYTHTKE